MVRSARCTGSGTDKPSHPLAARRSQTPKSAQTRRRDAAKSPQAPARKAPQTPRALLSGRHHELVDRVLDRVGDAVDVGQRVVVGEQAEVHPAFVGDDRDREGVVAREEGDGEDGPVSRGRGRTAGAAGRGLGDDAVEEPLREGQARRDPEDRRRPKFCSPARTSAPSACLDSFSSPIEARTGCRRPAGRRRRPAGPAHRGDPVAELVRLVAERNDTGTRARSSRPSVRTPRERSHVRPAADRRQDDVLTVRRTRP